MADAHTPATASLPPHDLAIPVLPCRSLDATGKFYRRLGFEGGAHEADYLKHAVQLKSYFDALAKEAVKRS